MNHIRFLRTILLTALIIIAIGGTTPPPLASANATAHLTAPAVKVAPPIDAPQPLQIGGGLTIPAGADTEGPASDYPSAVTAAAGMIVDVNVTLTGLTHTHMNDLVIALESPSNTFVRLMDDECAGEDPSGNFTFDDEAASTIDDIYNLGAGSCPINGGTFRASGTNGTTMMDTPAQSTADGSTLSTLEGEPAGGQWNLWVFDDATLDTGSLTSWSLVIVTTFGSVALQQVVGAEEGGSDGQVEIAFAPGLAAAITATLDVDTECFFAGQNPGDPLGLNFSAGETSRVVSLSAADDSDVERNHTCDVALTVDTSADPNYPTGDYGTVAVDIVDNDFGTLTLDSGNLSATEGGAGATFVTSFNPVPSGTVFVALDPDDQCQITTPGAPFLISVGGSPTIEGNGTPDAVDDNVIEGDHTCDMVFRVDSSNDPAYPAGTELLTLTFNITDNDAVDVAADTACTADGSLNVTVTAGDGNFDIRGVSGVSDTTVSDVALNTTVTFTDDNSGPNAYDITITERSGDTQVVTLATVNCNVPLTVDISCLSNGQANFNLLSADLSGAFPVAFNYVLNGGPFVASSLVFGNRTVGTAGITNNFSNLRLGENTGDDEIIRPADFSCAPTPATLTIVKDDTSDSDTAFDFTSDLGVTGSASFSLSDPSSNSITFNGITPGSGYSITEAAEAGFFVVDASCDNAQTPDNLTLNIGDTVTCTFVSSPFGAATLSQPQGDTFAEGTSSRVQINFAPDLTGNVTVRYTPDGECDMGNGPGVAVNAGVSTPTASTFRDVSVADNVLLDGTRNCTVDVEILTSDNPQYTVGNIGTVSFTITDDDSAAGNGGLLLDPNTLLVAEDEPGSNSFTVALGQAPVAGEIITVDFAYDGGQLALSQNSVTFDATTFNQPITISVDAVADGVAEEILPYDITVTTGSNLGNTALNGLTGTVVVTIFDNGDLIVLFVPNIGTLTIFTSSPTQVYEAASGGVLRDRATTAEVFLPRDADGNGFDTYTITDYSLSGETVWLAVWLGSRNWGWVMYDADTMLLEGDIWEMMYNE